MRVLVVEDDKVVHEFISRVLRESGFVVDTCSLFNESERLALEGVYDVLIVDTMLRDGDGLSLIERLRAQGFSAPVLILSDRRSVEDRVRGLDRGGDDYMTKPFAITELVARVRALLRRRAATQPEAARLCVGNLEMNLIRREVYRDGKELELTQQEFTVLEYLVRNSGRIVARTMLLNHVWNLRSDTPTNIVDVLIHRLRRKLGSNTQSPLIRTIRGVGYLLTDTLHSGK